MCVYLCIYVHMHVRVFIYMYMCVHVSAGCRSWRQLVVYLFSSPGGGRCSKYGNTFVSLRHSFLPWVPLPHSTHKWTACYLLVGEGSDYPCFHRGTLIRVFACVLVCLLDNCLFVYLRVCLCVCLLFVHLLFANLFVPMFIGVNMKCEFKLGFSSGSWMKRIPL